MKTRIQVLVDIDMSAEDIERMRKNLEDASWYVVRTYIGVHPELRHSANPFVQANEMAAP